jgi:uncharacterized protein DUF903
MIPKTRFLLLAAAVVALVACSSPQYVMSTKSGSMIITKGKPDLDTKTGMYSYEDSTGKKGTISKDEVGQIIER